METLQNDEGEELNFKENNFELVLKKKLRLILENISKLGSYLENSNKLQTRLDKTWHLK